MNQITKKLIEKFSPICTNRQVWEFEQINENLRFDVLYAEPENYSIESWDSKLACPDSDIRDVAVRNFDYLSDGYELWIANKGQGRLEAQFVPYVMTVMADTMIDEEVCLNFRIENDCLVISIDTKARCN